MQTLIQNMAKLFHPENRKWGVVLTVLIAVAIVGGVAYYGGYLHDLLKRVRAASSLTVNFNNPGEYTTTSNVTMASGYITVDAEFTPAFPFQFSPFTDITDLHYFPSLAITLAAVDIDQSVWYSADNGQSWDEFTTTSDIRIKRFAESTGLEGRVFGLGRTAGPNPAEEIGAIVHSELVANQLNDLEYIPLPDTYSVDSGIQKTTSGRLYAGVTPKIPSATSVAIYSASGTLGLPVYGYSIPWAKSVNNFLQTNNRIYATVSKDLAHVGTGDSLIYYKDNDDDSDWIQATFSGTTNHTAALSIAKDLAGYIYVTTDNGYIMKSQTPGGMGGSDVFDQINVPAASGLGFIHVDGYTGNLWLPLTNGTILRSVNGADFFEVNTAIDIDIAPSVLISDVITLSDGQTLWAGGFWQSGNPYKGVAWFGNAANAQTVVNNMTVPFNNLVSFSNVTVNGDFYYRISNVSNTGPWYYVNLAGDWVFSDDITTEASLAAYINTNISKFSSQVGAGNLFVQAIFYRNTNPVGFSSPILDSVTIEYDELPPPPTITDVIPNYGHVNGGNEVIIVGTDFNTNTYVVFGSNPSPLVEFVNSSLLNVIVPASTTGAGAVDVIVAEDVGNLTQSNRLVNGYTYKNVVITGIVPNYGKMAGGNEVFIEGIGFLAGGGINRVNFGAIQLLASDFTVDSDTQITATVPPGPGGLVAKVDVSVSSLAGSDVLIEGYTYVDNISSDIRVTQVVPNSGSYLGGNTVNIYGTGFDSTTFPINSVKFGVNEAISFSVKNDIYLTAVVPAGILGTQVDVIVANSDNMGVLPNGYTYMGIIVGTFRVDSVDPAKGDVAGGYPATIYGMGFTDPTVAPIVSVRFGVNEAPFTVTDNTTIAVSSVPAAAQIGFVDITVTGSGIITPAVLANGFEYVAGGIPPTITDIVPNIGPATGGTAVTITGTNFVSGATVTFGGTAAIVTFVSSTQLDIVTPVHTAGSVDVTVTNPDSQADTLVNGYTYLPAGNLFTIALNPDHGPATGGTLVNITPTNNINFGVSQGTGQVIFGAKSAGVIFWSDTLIRAIAPSGNGAVGVHVVTDAGSTSEDATYTYDSILTTPKTVRYLSPVYSVTEMIRLDSIAILAEDYPTNNNGGWVQVAVGLFAADGITPIFVGDDGLGTGYFVMTENSQDNLDKLMALNADPSFVNVRALRFRIFMYTPDNSLTIIDQPWVESVALDYTLASGEIGTITFATTETAPYAKYLPNDTNTPISYDLIATADLSANDPTFQNMIIGISWLDSPPVGLHAWVEVVPGYENNIITEFGYGAVVPFKIFLSTGMGINLLEGSYRFQVTGRLGGNTAITLTSSPEGTILTGSVAPDDFNLVMVEPIDQSTQANGVVTYTATIIYGASFTDNVVVDVDDLISKFGTDISSTDIIYGEIISNQQSVVITINISANPTNLDTPITFAVKGTAGTIVHTADASLTILSTISDAIMISLTIPTEDIPNTTLPSLFTLNLYPAGAATKDDYDLSLTNLAPTAVVGQIITIDVPVAKVLLTDGATYTVYARSTRHFWTQADNAGQLTIDLEQTTPHAVSFPQMTAGDIFPDNLINSIDVGYAVNQWFKSYPEEPDPAFLISDMNNDNFINSIDVGFLVNNWFEGGDPFFN